MSRPGDYGESMAEHPASGDMDRSVPIEQSTDRIPSQEDQDKIMGILKWADLIHAQAHSPWGIPWVTLHIATLAMGMEAEWANDANSRISRRYRARIDTPMDEAELNQMGDHLPEGWT